MTYLLVATDNWQSYDSYRLIGTYNSKDKALIALKKHQSKYDDLVVFRQRNDEHVYGDKIKSKSGN